MNVGDCFSYDVAKEHSCPLLNILEAKNNLSQPIKAARDGEEVVIANRGEPAVRLVPAGPAAATAAEAGRARSVSSVFGPTAFCEDRAGSGQKYPKRAWAGSGWRKLAR
ncbi:MAG TPA: type II toxin-antitoxin system prevent-host-death family antitoxin [Stellaceae bacterium]|nr:type II toxin-antitoxin system prevent-host-death family antitoxin [Stellaceae bacterium]